MQMLADAVLTSQEAADLVGVSRPFMDARIDSGDIPLNQQVGKLRCVLKSDVLNWQEHSKRQQGEAIATLVNCIDKEYDDEDK
jgi:excisionase family DNA binding protein